MADKYADALTRVVLRTMSLMFPLEPRPVARRSVNRREAPFEVSAIIGVTGTTRGSLVISFPMEVAKRLAGWMLHESDPARCTQQDVSDCVGELANIIAGNLLPLLSGNGSEGTESRISLPSVVVGPHRVVWSRKDTPCELVIFESDAGAFAAEINFREVLIES